MAEQNQEQFVAQLAKATGVGRADVEKVLGKLGFSAAYDAATRSAAGKKLPLTSVRVGFKLGKSTIVV